MITYGYSVRWRERRGVYCEAHVNGCASVDEAFLASFEAAKRMGYKQATWRQIMRWFNEIDYEAKAAAIRARTEERR